MSYEIAPLTKVKSDFPEFREVMANVEAGISTRAQQIWVGFTKGGLRPTTNQFGLSNIPPRFMASGGNLSKGYGSWSFMQTFTTPGSWVNIFSYAIPVDQIHGFAGFSFVGPNQIFNALRAQIAEIVFPIVEIEENKAWGSFFGGGFQVVIKQDRGQEWIIQEKALFTLKGWQERGTLGFNQRIIPIGLMAYRSRDDLISLSAPAV